MASAWIMLVVVHRYIYNHALLKVFAEYLGFKNIFELLALVFHQSWMVILTLFSVVHGDIHIIADGKPARLPGRHSAPTSYGQLWSLPAQRVQPRFNHNSQMNWEWCTANVIITCQQCKDRYVSQTMWLFTQCLSEHLCYVWLQKDEPTGVYFSKPQHSTSSTCYRVKTHNRKQ